MAKSHPTTGPLMEIDEDSVGTVDPVHKASNPHCKAIYKNNGKAMALALSPAFKLYMVP